MDAHKVDMFMMMNSKYLDSNQLVNIKKYLLSMDESAWPSVEFLQFKDPSTSLLVSIFAGGLGIDRFYIGHTGIGVAKLLTCGGFYIWTIVDWFLIQNATREVNMQKLREAVEFSQNRNA